jgi:hypothetical protein
MRESALQGRCRRGCRQQGLGEALLIGQRKTDHFRLLDGALRGLLHRGNNEIGHGAPLELGRSLEHRVQIGTDAGFQAGSGMGMR